MQHPIKRADDLARQLQEDPIATSQIKEIIKPADLRHLLGVELTQEDVVEWLDQYSRTAEPRTKRMIGEILDEIEGIPE